MTLCNHYNTQKTGSCLFPLKRVKQHPVQRYGKLNVVAWVAFLAGIRPVAVPRNFAEVADIAAPGPDKQAVGERADTPVDRAHTPADTAVQLVGTVDRAVGMVAEAAGKAAWDFSCYRH